MKLKPTETVTVDGVVYSVLTLSDEIKAIIDVYDEVRKDHEKARLEYLKCQAALKELGTQIANSVNAFNTAAQEQASLDTDDE